MSAIEAVLFALFAEAQASGEVFIDVSSKGLSAAMGADKSSARTLTRCCRLLRHRMIPGDHELSTCHGRNSGALLIRFRLPR